MNIYTNPNSSFPSQVVSDEEKSSQDYGMAVGRAIEQEWFQQGRAGNRFALSWNHFHQLRLYARGEQSVQKYKDELSINGDLSYLNIDWKPVPILSKFVDIVVNGMSQKKYEISAYAQDPSSQKARTQYAASLLRDMTIKKEAMAVSNAIGVNVLKHDPSTLPSNEDELSLHMQLTYKQSVEIAEEEAINNTLAFNKYDLVRRRLNMDLTVLGISCAKTHWNRSNGITVDYVDPANLVYSYTDDPNFEDIYYVGEVKSVTIPELKKQYPDISEEMLKRIQDMPGNRQFVTGWNNYDENTVQVMYFEYKTYNNQTFKIKQTDQGLEKALEKPDTFNPPVNDDYERVSRSIEVLYSGCKVLGINEMLEWKLAQNMTRPQSDTSKVEMNYTIVAPRMYKGRIESIVSKCIGFADMIQLTHLKLQQVMSRIVPDGVFVDVDGLAEVDLGNGTNYNAQEALNMFFQTGSIVGRSLTQDGELNRGKVPIQELSSSSGQAKIASLIQTYNYYLQMIRDVTGLNEARDGSAPDRDTLVGLQKMAANASNIATKHIMQAQLYLTLRICENISLRIADSLKFPLLRNTLVSALSKYNTETLSELEKTSIHDFGIYLNLEPEEEEQQQLEQNIQIALQGGGIDLEDAIDLRQIKNLKLANQTLKLKRKQKQAREERLAKENIQAQAQANAQQAEKAAMNEVQKQQALTQEKVNFEQARSQMEMQRMQTEAMIKKEIMAAQFDYDLQLAQVSVGQVQEKEQYIEDRKDKRTKIQATQQSQMINQRKNDLLPKDFENQDQNINVGLEELPT